MSRRNIPPMVILAAYVSLTVGSIAGLCWLAPLEYGTGRWLGLGEHLAVVVPALIDSYVVLAVLTARDRTWALPIAALSGGVGQLHAAQVLPETSLTVRAWVATIAIGIAVVVTARLKPLAVVVTRTYWERVAASAAERTAREQAHAATVRAHELELIAAESAARDAEHRRTQEAVEAAHRRELELTRAAHAPVAETPVTERTQPARPAHAPRRTPPPAKRTVEAHAPDDLAVRRIVRGQWNARTEAGRKTPNAAVARTLGIESGPARALVSRWKKDRTATGGTGARATSTDDRAPAANDK